VAALEPNRFPGLHGLSDLRGRRLDPKQPRPSAYTEGLWGFLLKELPGGRENDLRQFPVQRQSGQRE
jgi:hypothetical protein